VHKKKTYYELMHGRTPKVSHFHVFGCKCFILKKGKKLDKFEARLVDEKPIPHARGALDLLTVGFPRARV
jgi:hypothetical protein